jgi:hypothetical protein
MPERLPGFQLQTLFHQYSILRRKDTIGCIEITGNRSIAAGHGDGGDGLVRVVNSHATARGDSIAAKDSATGKLVSRDFSVESNFITFWVSAARSRPTRAWV